jgi:drug/metabolite transporter (DMT)-like permease
MNDRAMSPPPPSSGTTAPVSVAAARPSSRSAAGRTPWIGYGLACVGATLFATKAIIVKLAYAEGVDAETLLAVRMILSLPVYLAIGLHGLLPSRRGPFDHANGRLILRALGVGALGYWLSSYLDFKGLELISAQFERLILFTYPFFVMLFGVVFFRQPIKLKSLAAFAISYGGLLLLFLRDFSRGGDDAALGAAFVMAAGISFALYQLLAKNIIVNMGPRLFTCTAMSAASAVVIAQFLLTHPAHQLVLTPHIWMLGVALAIGGTILPSFFMNAALHRISAQANSMIGTLSPVITILLAVAILAEPLAGLDILAAVLVIVGVFFATLADRR